MCIRDRYAIGDDGGTILDAVDADDIARTKAAFDAMLDVIGCLLYTSDAADERSSVDLGGRRIIKKKTSTDTSAHGD